MITEINTLDHKNLLNFSWGSDLGFLPLYPIPGIGFSPKIGGTMKESVSQIASYFLSTAKELNQFKKVNASLRP